MSFWETFVSLCTEKNKAPNTVARELSISSGSITNWKNGKVPHFQTLSKIASYFDVSVDYLTGKDGQSVNIGRIKDNRGGFIGQANAPVTINNGETQSLTEDEMELLKIYRELSRVDRAKVLVYTDELIKKSKEV